MQTKKVELTSPTINPPHMLKLLFRVYIDNLINLYQFVVKPINKVARNKTKERTNKNTHMRTHILAHINLVHKMG